MSVAPGDPMNLSRHRRPAALNGTGKDPLWEIDGTDLGSDLEFLQDSRTHGLIVPVREMTLAEFQLALLSTRTRWKPVTA